MNRPLSGFCQNASALHGELVEHLKEAQGAERDVGVDFGVVDVVDDVLVAVTDLDYRRGQRWRRLHASSRC